MRSLRLSILLLACALIGCGGTTTPGGAATLLWQQLVSDPNGLSNQDTPTVNDGHIRVHLENAAAEVADARITMRLAGQRVHFSERTVPSGDDQIVVGPDRADAILVELTLHDGALVEGPLRSFFLGQDFQNGDTIDVVITAQPVEEPGKPPPPEPNAPVEPNVPEPNLPEPLRIWIEGLDADEPLNPGMTATFDVRVAGTRSNAAYVNVTAGPDVSKLRATDIPILSEVPADDSIPVRWTVPQLELGPYSVTAEVCDLGVCIQSAPTAGRIRVRFAPQLAFDSPRPEQIVTRGRPLAITWAGYDADDNATITLFLDTDEAFDGNEPVLRAGISEDDLNDREYTFDTHDVATGTYYVGGLIDDGLSSSVSYAGPIYVISRLVGRFSPSDLAASEITTITGGADNRLFGTSLDCSGSLVGAQGPYADLLVGDPGGGFDSDGSRVEPGKAYYFRGSNQPWPSSLTVADATLSFVGQNDGDQAGHRCAFIPALGEAQPGDHDVLIGAPQWNAPNDPPQGRAYLLDGDALSALIGEWSEISLNLNCPRPGVQLWGDWSATLGYDVAGLGDIDASGHTDFLIGAPHATGGTGRIHVLTGDHWPPQDYASLSAGLILIGVAPVERTGYAVHGVPDVDNDGDDEFVVGAPRGFQHGDSTTDPRTGVVYLVLGAPGILDNAAARYLANLGTPPAPDGRIFAGENDGDYAGWSLASGDFDSDGTIDLLIGAPGHDHARGRVYLICNIGDPNLPQPPNVIDLGLVGTVYPGATFDGLAIGDQLGYAVQAAGDFDGDGLPDMLFGAPSVESQRGSAYLIYGLPAPGIRGAHSLAELNTAALEGWELVGDPNEISRLGTAFSSGEMNGDDRTDVGVGAPGDPNSPGRAYLLWGWPVAPVN